MIEFNSLANDLQCIIKCVIMSVFMNIDKRLTINDKKLLTKIRWRDILYTTKQI